MESKFQNALMVVAVACALVSTGLAVKRSMQPQVGGPRPPVAVGGVDSIITSAPHVSGPSDAQVTIVEFFDLQCPACRMFSFALDTVMRTSGVTIRVARHHFPLTSIHPRAQSLALVGLCLEKEEQFSRYYHRAFELQGLLAADGDQGIMLALPEGADSAAVRACMTRSASWDRLQRELSLAEGLGISGTPAFIVGGMLYSGARSASELTRLVREAAR